MLNVDLPLLPPPEELNRLTVTLHDYGIPEGLSVRTLVDLMSSSNFGGRIAGHRDTIAFATAARLIESSGESVRLTALGRELLALNEDSTYELAQGQAAFLAKECIFRPPYIEVSRSLFSRFTNDRSGRLSVHLPLSSVSPLECSLLDFLRNLRVLTVEDDTVRIEAGVYSRMVPRPSLNLLTQEQLDGLLEQQKWVGREAEHQALDFERQRLLRKGYATEAEKVRLISDSNVSAGFDIESYDGASPSLEFDRFIEVKSTSLEQPAFIWSANELATANGLGPKYWIYLATAFRPGIPQAQWIMINDPAAECEAGGRIYLEPLTYHAFFKGSNWPSVA